MAVAVLLGLAARAATAQDDIRDYRKPVLSVETGGHGAPVRALVWAASGELYSAGHDKTVRVWDVGPQPRLRTVIRPPVWRGQAGAVYALALSRPDAGGSAFLAVAGFGVEAGRGDVTVFRVPGERRSGTGDPVARLVSGANADAPAHTQSVSCLAFSPDGGTLASGSGDGTVALWKVPSFQVARAPLDPKGGAVRALAFRPGAREVAVGYADGTVRVWDYDNGVVTQVRPGDRLRPDSVNSLAYTPATGLLVVALESGQVQQWSAAAINDLGGGLKSRTGSPRGPAESVAVSPDGRWLLASIKATRSDALADPRSVACDVELWSLADGTLRVRRPVLGLVYGLAFRPDSTQFAYGGGPASEVRVVPVDTPNAPGVALRGNGTGVYDLGFTADSATVGFEREPLGPDAPRADELDGIGLDPRTFRRVPRAGLRGALRSYDGWEVRGTLNGLWLEAVHADGRRVPLALDPVEERNWWSWTFVPPGPGHDRLVLAVGFETGVVLYELPGGRRTRLLAGHGAAVTAMAPSPDGRWLATGSFDQTVRFTPLAGCDAPAPLGVRFEAAPGGELTVAAVEPRSVAAAMDFRPGDVVEGVDLGPSDRVRYAPAAAAPAAFTSLAAEAREGDRLQLLVLSSSVSGPQEHQGWERAALVAGALLGGPATPVVPLPRLGWGLFPSQAVASGPAATTTAVAPGPGGLGVVTAVTPGGLGAAMGLQPGDLLLAAASHQVARSRRGFLRPPFEPAALLARVEAMEPGDTVVVRIRRKPAEPGGAPLQTFLRTTRRTTPALAAFVGRDREWVTWMPQGFYDTSVEGDARFLGWHMNAPFRFDPGVRPEPSDFVKASTYMGRLYRPEVLDRLWRTADLNLALAAAPGPPGGAEPVARAPEIRFEAAPGAAPLPAQGLTWVVRAADPQVVVRVTRPAASPPLKSVRVTLDGVERPSLQPANPGVLDLGQILTLTGLPPFREAALVVQVVDDAGAVRDARLVVRYEPAVAVRPPGEPRLFFVGIGCDESRLAGLGRVPYAAADATEMARFLPRHLLGPSGARPRSARPPAAWVGADATSDRLVGGLELLTRDGSDRPGPGDVVVVVIVAHVLDLGGREAVVTADTAGGPPPRPVVSATELAERLGDLAGYGARVVLFLDGIHEMPADATYRAGLKALARDLWFQRGVVTFVASEERPGLVSGTHGVFTQSLLTAFGYEVPGHRADSPYTLREFSQAVRTAASELSNRRQEVRCHVPESVLPESAFATPVRAAAGDR